MNKSSKDRILDAGLKVWPDVSFSSIAREIGMTRQGVACHFSLEDLRNAVAQRAVKTKNSKIISHLLLSDHSAVRKMPQAERLKHFLNSAAI